MSQFVPLLYVLVIALVIALGKKSKDPGHSKGPLTPSPHRPPTLSLTSQAKSAWLSLSWSYIYL